MRIRSANLLDGRRRDNDRAAGACVPSGFGGDDSAVDLTALAGAVPRAARKTPAKEAVQETASAQTAHKAAAPAAERARKTAK